VFRYRPTGSTTYFIILFYYYRRECYSDRDIIYCAYVVCRGGYDVPYIILYRYIIIGDLQVLARKRPLNRRFTHSSYIRNYIIILLCVGLVITREFRTASLPSLDNRRRMFWTHWCRRSAPRPYNIYPMYGNWYIILLV